MKHVKRRHFFVRDMVETMEIEVPFVRTADNIVDFFTKPMTAGKFRAFSRARRPSSSVWALLPMVALA